MKFSLKSLVLCVVAALGLSAANIASAVSILQFGGSTMLAPSTPNTADALTDFIGTNGVAGTLSVINGSTGIFGSLPVGQDFLADSPLVFDGIESAPSPLFSFGLYNFVLDTSTLGFVQGPPASFLTVFGSGTIFGPGDFEEMADLSISTSGTSDGGRISIQGNLVTSNVPDGGATLLLLGGSLLSMAGIRRFTAR